MGGLGVIRASLSIPTQDEMEGLGVPRVRVISVLVKEQDGGCKPGINFKMLSPT
jgi:hypothetical protein